MRVRHYCKLTYEALYKSLGRTYLVEAGDLAAEADHTGRLMETLIELPVFDIQAGEGIAQSLASLYMYKVGTKLARRMDESFAAAGTSSRAA